MINLATKIQSIGEPGSVNLGATTLRNIHTKWRLGCREVELPEHWPYRDRGKGPYRVFRFEGLVTPVDACAVAEEGQEEGAEEGV